MISQINMDYGLLRMLQAHGAEVCGKKVGSLGTCAAFSFFGNKIITTGEGGMVTTNDTKLAKKLRLYPNGFNHRYWFPSWV